jgi:hypothetical protein
VSESGCRTRCRGCALAIVDLKKIWLCLCLFSNKMEQNSRRLRDEENHRAAAAHCGRGGVAGSVGSRP